MKFNMAQPLPPLEALTLTVQEIHTNHVLYETPGIKRFGIIMPREMWDAYGRPPAVYIGTDH